MSEVFDVEATITAIADELKVSKTSVRAVLDLLDAGSTIPFIARYRKEATRGLDEIQLRAVEDALEKARELASRKATILKTIEQQGLLTDALRQQILDCMDKLTLENLYLPYKPKRKTRAEAARQRGLQPLADLLADQQTLGRQKRDVVQPFVRPEQDVADYDAAVAGACDIVAEQWSEDLDARQWMHEQAQGFGKIASKVKRGKADDAAKFEQYFDHRESLKRIPSHRLLAMKRGEAEGLLRISLEMDEEFTLRKLRQRFISNHQFEFHQELLATVEDCFRRLLLPATESAALQQLKEQADEQAIGVFATNLRELLLAPPAGRQVTIGLDPGFRTGCKVAVVDDTGKFLESATIFPTPPKNDTRGATETLMRLIKAHDVKLIAIGNGTASRETDQFVKDLLKEQKLDVTSAMVSESGASIYSASELASHEYPDLDVTVRRAISIAHRLQDPLAELVKLDPKSIGVGQYQHDVNQTWLRKALEREVESCVNNVGVDVNTASPSLLSFVSGIGPKLAENIVAYRDDQSQFAQRADLKRVPKLGAKAFQQSAGFLRIRGGRQPLDNSAVHPESYGVVERMAQVLGVKPQALVGNSALVSKLNARDFVDDQFGLPTIEDILTELAKPGRDPRREFRAVAFKEGVNEIGDLKAGMTLEGVVTNVTHFGAFVDLGVHQDGLIHISQLADHFIEDPSEVVKVGDVVRVKVLEVDLDKKRISLTRKF